MLQGGLFWFFPKKIQVGFPKVITLPETNVAPENRPSQWESSIPTIHFQGRKC